MDVLGEYGFMSTLAEKNAKETPKELSFNSPDNVFTF